MHPLESLMRAAALDDSHDNQPDGVTLDPAAQVMELERWAADHAAGAGRFQVGQFVTPKACSPVSGKGQPHLVLDLRPDMDCDFSVGGPDTIAWGRNRNMRVACYANNRVIATYWVEPCDFEPWSPPAAARS